MSGSKGFILSLVLVVLAASTPACSSGDEDNLGGAGGAASLPAYILADGVSITAVDFYQTVKRPLFPEASQQPYLVPIVARKDSLIRVYCTTEADFNGKPVLVRLTLDEQEPIVLQATLGTASDETNLASTINIPIPGSQLEPGAHSYQIEILQARALASGSNLSARYPAEDRAVLQAEGPGDPLRIVFVPVSYNGDGSGRLPDTSEEQLQRFKNRFVQLYPTHELSVSVDPPLPWSGQLQPNIGGWQELLQRLVDYRKTANPPANVYYYGLFRPRETFGAYCGSGCVTGLSLLGTDPAVSFARVGMGMGFTGDASANTAVHEVGHMHGLQHAPCNTSSNVDPQYPHAEASIGTYGYNHVNSMLVSPTDHRDFMSYCQPEWTSDYNYIKLFQRHVFLASSAQKVSQPESYYRFNVDAAGQLQRLAPMTLALAPGGSQRRLELLDSQEGIHEASGYWFPYSHGGGGMLLVPKAKIHLPSDATIRLASPKRPMASSRSEKKCSNYK